MAKTWRLSCRLMLPLAREQLFPFFADAHNLELLTPPWLRFEILTPRPIAMRAGARIDYRIRLHGIPLRWRTNITGWDPPAAFADEQVSGPYARWFHRHMFRAVGSDTEVIDDIDMRPRGGPLAPLLQRWFVRGDVERIFRHRAQVLCSLFGGDPASAVMEWLKGTDRPPARS